MQPDSPMKAIRRFCVEQCNADTPSEVKSCAGNAWVMGACPLYAFRTGRKPLGASTLKAIRKHCLMCFNGDTAGVRECQDMECPLFPFRLGKNPNFSEETRQKRREVCLARHEGKDAGTAAS